MNKEVFLKDIAGYDDEKEEAKKIIEVLKNHKKYEEYGAKIPKGLILSGNPGVGKTMLAKAIANESGVPLYEFETNESETESETIKSIKEIFKRARNATPSIIFIDELDELVMTTDFASDYSRKVLKILLSEIDGISSTEGILVIATTNYRAMLPPALTRSGRMDKHITIDMPDWYSREAIFNLYLRKHDCLKNIDSKLLANKTANFSGADIFTLINETIIDCASKEKAEITIEDFERNIPVIKFQDIKKKSKNGPEDYVCYHEIGHFITEFKLFGSIGSISTEKYGDIKGHVLLEMDEIEDLSLGCVSKSSIKNKLVTLLGGMAAEDVLYGDVTNGASLDIGEARTYIKSLMAVGAYGFDLMPNIIQTSRFSKTTSQVSQEKLRKIEEFESSILDEAYEQAKRIITDNKELCELLFKELKAKEKLTVKEINNMIIDFKKTSN